MRDAVASDGDSVAGLAVFKTHLSYLPFSGSVLSQVADDRSGYTMTRSSVLFSAERPLPRALVAKLVTVRLAEAPWRRHRRAEEPKYRPGCLSL